ncbi:MAG: hypothetical protein HYZ43_04340 [Flavobacteriia bacterium]|nr:hypothetical protein [Flavobacteriia bacterium]
MKKLGLILAGFSGFAAYAQPEIENWLMNQGEYASYWQNTGGQGQPDNFVFSTSTVLANVTRVCYNSTYVWVESDGMTTNMGQFLNPGAPTEQNYTYRFPRTPTVPATKTGSPYVGSIGLLNNGVTVYGLSNAHYYNGSWIRFRRLPDLRTIWLYNGYGCIQRYFTDENRLWIA